MINRAAFIDRDGVINSKAPEPEYVTRWEDFHFLPGVAEAVEQLNRAGFRVIVVTNQRCVAKGLLTLEQLDALHQRMCQQLADGGAVIDDILVCPHDTDTQCACRKPEPGMLLDAARTYSIELGCSWMVGDSDGDVEAGRRAGCKTLRLLAPGKKQTKQADMTAGSLLEAVHCILHSEQYVCRDPGPWRTTEVGLSSGLRAKGFMKIAFVFPPMWPAEDDGSLQIWNREVTQRFATNHDVIVYSRAAGRGPHEVIHGVRYRRFAALWDARFLRRAELLHRLLRVQRPLFSFDFYYALYALNVALDLRKERCDIVHVYNFPQHAAVIQRLNPQARVVLNMHGEWLSQAPFNDLAARLCRLDLILGCSDLVTSSIRTRFPYLANRCETVPMGVSVENLSGARNGSRRRNRFGRELLYVGRISPEKGLHVLLDAFELIVREYPDARLTIVGHEGVAPREYIADLCLDKKVTASLAPFYQGSYLSQLKRRLSSQAAGRVTFAGPVPHDRVAMYYEKADVCVNPSFYESFGMSIIEAMAAGIPVVAARGGAVPRLISDGRTGVLVEAGSAPALAEAVVTLFRNSDAIPQMVCRARDSVRQQFEWETICSSLMQMYTRALLS